MKACLYCGAQYPDDVLVCPVDQHALGNPAEAKPPGRIDPAGTICPGCGVSGDYTFVVEPRSSFSLLAFLGGGLPAVFFRNAGRRRRVRCNRCEARYYVRSPLGKISQVIFWLLVAPTIIVLIILLAELVGTLSHR